MSIADKLQTVRAQIRKATVDAGRAENSVKLMAVSKTRPASDVLTAIQAGQRHFGENYVQEAVDKKHAVDMALPSVAEAIRPVWHFIGPLQSNKTAQVAEHFDWLHTLERLKIARRLSEQRPHGHAPLNVCLQINISDEDTKAGLPAEAGAIQELAVAVQSLPGLRLRGLMCIPSAGLTDDALAAEFAQMRRLLEALRVSIQEGFGADAAGYIDTLSMGMSADMGLAIHEGATIVRIGTAIFGERH